MKQLNATRIAEHAVKNCLENGMTSGVVRKSAAASFIAIPAQFCAEQSVWDETTEKRMQASGNSTMLTQKRASPLAHVR